jgi:hypothetical protein
MAGTDGVEDRILVLAPIGRDAAAIVSVLSRAGLCGEICPTLPDLIRSLDAGAGSAFIGEEALFVPEAELLISWIQQQPAWSDFPFILLTRSNSPAVLIRWRRGLLKNIPNVLLLERPADALTPAWALPLSAVGSGNTKFELILRSVLPLPSTSKRKSPSGRPNY